MLHDVSQCRRCQSKTSNNMAAERSDLLLLQTFRHFTEPSGATGEREKYGLSSVCCWLLVLEISDGLVQRSTSLWFCS
jgi:hypothetical protein